MKTHRTTTLIVITVCVISLILARIFYSFYSHKSELDNNFYYSLFLGIFTSGIVVLVTSFVGYKIEKEKSTKDLIARITKLKTHYEDVRILVNPRNISIFDGNLPRIDENILFREVKQLLTNVLWTPRSDRISWHASTRKPPNITFSTYFQRTEFDFIKTCSELHEVCYAYWDCYRKNQRASNGDFIINSHFESGCRTDLIRFFYRETDFPTYLNTYLDLLTGKKIPS